MSCATAQKKAQRRPGNSATALAKLLVALVGALGVRYDARTKRHAGREFLCGGPPGGSVSGGGEGRPFPSAVTAECPSTTLSAAVSTSAPGAGPFPSALSAGVLRRLCLRQC